MLENLNNYYIYSELAKNSKMTVHTNSINLDTWNSHYEGILNIMRDGIETPEVQNMFITIIFDKDNETVDLSVPDYFLNIMMWYPMIFIHKDIHVWHIFFHEHTTGDNIKDYIDKYFVIPNRLTVDNKILNNGIADTLYNFSNIDDFSLYLANTLNLEDDIDLMEKSPRYNELIHCDLSNVPIEKVKDEGMKIVNEAVDDYIIPSKKILGYEHCLKNAFSAQEGINIRQYKEENFNIGTKPDGQGSIYHEFINQSYITGGLDRLLYQFIDSGASRVAQIISKKNVGESGGFSRILGLNNQNSFLNSDPTFDCGTKNFEHILIPNKKIFNLLIDRYYRMHPNGIERKITPNDTNLIGQYIYLRSPMCCNSFAHGHGICYKCYGDLAYTNNDINIGRIASELITSQYTQKRLSAKHLLETKVEVIKWVKEFYSFFEIDINEIKLLSSLFDNKKKMDGWDITFDLEDIQVENEETDMLDHRFFDSNPKDSDGELAFYNYYITKLFISTPEGDRIPIYSIDDSGTPTETKMYISNQFLNIIARYMKKEENKDEEISIPFNELQDATIFLIKIQNNDLGKNLDKFTDLIDKQTVTKTYDKDRILEAMQDIILKGGIHSMSIHLEVIMANQIRSAYDRLKMPDWSNPNEPYEILTLNEALTDHPSITVSLEYQKLKKALFYPSSFNKTNPSMYDLFFMRTPKKFLNADHEVYDEIERRSIKPGESPVMFIHDHDKKEKPKDIQELINKYRKEPKTHL